MNKIKKYVFVFFMIFLLAGCNKTTTTSNKTEDVTDETVISLLQNKITILENLDKTKEIYTKGDGKATDYTDEDKIRYGIEYKISYTGLPALSAQEINALKAKGITNVASYIEVKDVTENINSTFNDSIKKHIDASGCPKYTYDSENEKYYIESKCETMDATSIVSKIDKVTKKGNKYYVLVYAGLNDGTNVYSDFEKKNLIRTLSINDSYSITEDDMKMFTKFTYTFEKTKEDKYIFKSLTKTK